MCQSHPKNVLFDFQGNPLKIRGEMDHAAEMNCVKETTFNEPQMLASIFFHLHNRYNHDVVALLNTLQSREGFQSFLRNSIARDIVVSEEG